MATPTITGLTLIDDCEDTTGWSAIATSKPNQASDSVKEGSNSVGMEQKLTGVQGVRYNGSWDLSSDLLWVWIYVGAAATLQNLANGGVRIYATDGTNTAYWYVGGSDVEWCYRGWKRLGIDLNRTPDSGTAPTLTTLTYIGVAINIVSTLGKADGLFVDILHYGNSIEVTGGTSGDPVTLQDIHDTDQGGSGNFYGLIEKKGAVFELTGGLIFGDVTGASNTYVTMGGEVCLWADNPLKEDNSSSYLRVTEDTGTTSLIVGSSSGTGESQVGYGGVTMFRDAGDFDLGYTLDWDEAVDGLEVFGSTFTGATGGIKLAADTGHLFKNNTVAQCGQLSPGTVVVRNCTFTETTAVRSDDYVDNVTLYDFGTTTYTEYTTAANEATANDVPLTSASPLSNNDLLYVGRKTKFGKITITVGTAGAGTYTIGMQYFTGTTWAALTHIDGTSDFKTSGTNDITFTAPSDWEPTMWMPYANENLYLVRFTNNAGTLTTQPLATQMWVLADLDAPDGDALDMSGGTVNATDCNFLANTHPVGSVGGVLARTVVGSKNLTDMVFAGNDWDLTQTAPSALVDSYPRVNDAGGFWDLADTYSGVAQSFTTGVARVLTRVTSHARRVGSPTGTIVCKVYAHSGTYGTSSVPTGTALATSTNTVDVSTIPLTYHDEITFEFDGSWTYSATTQYVVAFEHTGTGSASNEILFPVDNTTPTHGGNASNYVSSWTASSGIDLCFYLYGDGFVTVSNLGTSDAATARELGRPKSATLIETNVTLQVTGVVESTACLIICKAGGPEAEGTELLNTLANSSGVASTTYNYTSSQPVTISARNSGICTQVENYDQTKYTDYTSQSNERETLSDVKVFATTPTVGDYFYIGGHSTFDEVTHYVNTATEASSVTWQYWDGDLWSTMTTSGDDDFSATGWKKMTFTEPDGWSTTAVDGGSQLYFIRALPAGEISTQPILGSITINHTKYKPFSIDTTITGALTQKAVWLIDTTA